MAGKYDFTIEQGSNLSFEVQYKNQDGSIFDFTGYSAKLQVRKSVSATDVLIELVSPTNIIFNIPLGKMTITFLPEHTTPLANSAQKLVLTAGPSKLFPNAVAPLEEELIYYKSPTGMTLDDRNQDGPFNTNMTSTVTATSYKSDRYGFSSLYFSEYAYCDFMCI